MCCTFSSCFLFNKLYQGGSYSYSFMPTLFDQGVKVNMLAVLHITRTLSNSNEKFENLGMQNLKKGLLTDGKKLL